MSFGYQRHLRTVYLDKSADQALDDRAKAEGITKGMLVRRYFREGLREPNPPAQPARQMPFITRSFYLEDDLASSLASRASSEGVTEAELMRRFIDEGLAAPPKPQAVTRLHEVAFLRSGHAACLQAAEEAARRFLEPAERIRRELVAQLEALQECCPHGNVVGTDDCSSIYDCGCDHHFPTATMCLDCGIVWGVCPEHDDGYYSGTKVSKEEFKRLHDAFPYREFLKSADR